MAINYFRTDGWVKSTQGPAVPGAQVYVCTQPANATALPPTPLANIFSDVNGLVPITQPIITDGFGHYDFYAAAAVYTVVVGLGGVIQQVYPDQSVGGASGTTGGGGGTALSIQVNGSPTVNQLLANFRGTGGTSVASDGSGNITITSVSTVLSTTSGAFFIGAGQRDVAQVIQTAVGNYLVGANNLVYAFQFTLDSTWVLSSVSYQFTGGSTPSELAFFGFYDQNKNLLLSTTFDATLTTLQTKTFAPLTLQAGQTYYFAQSDTIGGGARGPSTGGGTADTTQILNALGVGIPVISTAANPIVGGSLPPTLGALTNMIVSNYAGMAVCIWKT